MTQKIFNWTILLALAVGFNSCNGQVEKDQSKEKRRESKKIPVGQPKLIKTLGSMEGDNVHCSLEDKAGNLWFGTTGEGVYKYDGKSFSQFTAADGLYSNTVWCILEDKDGKVWIGTSAGVSFYDGKNISKVRITSSNESSLIPENSQSTTQYNDSDVEVFSIMQDKNGGLWFATLDGVYTYDGIFFTFFIVNEGGSGFKSSNNNVEYILEDNTGNIWFGGRMNDGVFCYDGKSVTNFKLNELKGHNWAWPVLQDRNGIIWFSNWGGTYRYDGKSFTSFTTDDGLPNGAITRIIEDKKGNLWFGSESSGICRYDGKSFTHFTTKDGLVSDSIWSILEDKNGNIWVGTRNTGLNLYDGKTFTSFSEIK